MIGNHVGIRDMVVAKPAPTAIADMVFTEQVGSPDPRTLNPPVRPELAYFQPHFSR